MFLIEHNKEQSKCFQIINAMNTHKMISTEIYSGLHPFSVTYPPTSTQSAGVTLQIATLNTSSTQATTYVSRVGMYFNGHVDAMRSRSTDTLVFCSSATTTLKSNTCASCCERVRVCLCAQVHVA